MCIFKYVYLYAYVNIFEYIHTYIHINICIYIYICIGLDMIMDGSADLSTLITKPKEVASVSTAIEVAKEVEVVEGMDVEIGKKAEGI
jgi:hypothetical protein